MFSYAYWMLIVSQQWYKALSLAQQICYSLHARPADATHNVNISQKHVCATPLTIVFGDAVRIENTMGTLEINVRR